MPKSKKKRTDNRPVDREPGSQDIAVERRGRRTQYIIISVVSALILIIVGIFYYQERVAPFRRIIITVDDITINMDYFLTRTRLANADPMVILEELTKEQIIKLEAPKYIREVSPEDIDQELRRVAQGQSETISEAEFREWYRQQLNEISLSDSEFKDIIAINILRARLHEYLAERVPTVAEQVHLHAIALETYEDAEKVRARWEAGEDFAALAKEVSLDLEFKEKGGDLGWFPRSVMDYRFDYVAFTLSPGEVSEPVPYMIESQQSAGGAAAAPQTYYYLLMVSEKAAAREVAEHFLPVLRARVLEDWLTERMDSHEIKYNFNSEIYAWINWQLTKMAGKE